MRIAERRAALLDELGQQTLGGDTRGRIVEISEKLVVLDGLPLIEEVGMLVTSFLHRSPQFTNQQVAFSLLAHQEAVQVAKLAVEGIRVIL